MKNKGRNREIAVVDKQNQKRLLVSLRHVATPDEKERLRRATDILLKAATRDTSNHPGESTKTMA